MRVLTLLLVLIFIFIGTYLVSAQSREPENSRSLAKALAVYPSAKLPPISQPNMLGFYNMPCSRAKQKMVHQWVPHWNLLTNVRRRIGKNHQLSETVEYCTKNGILPLNYIKGPMIKKWDREGDWINYYLSAARNKHILGIGVDEWQRDGVVAYGGTKVVEFAANSLILTKQEHPEFYQMVFWRGEDNCIKEVIKQNGIDLLMIEGYTYVHQRHDWTVSLQGTLKRINLARKWGAIEQTIVMLGQLTNVPCKTAPNLKPPEEAEFEKQIQYIRKHAPEMPGIAFYVAGRRDFEELKEKLQACDRLFVKYYLKPAPQVTIKSPKQDELLTGMCKISATASPKNAENTIIEYLWFIDNRLMARTKVTHWNWNTRLETPGKHIVTVQAIDSAYNRGVKQIKVEVK